MSSAADVDLTFTIEFEARKFILKRPDFQVEGEMSDWVTQRAFAACETIPDPATRSQAVAAVAGEYGAGMYAYEYDPRLGQVNYTNKALNTFTGARQWLYFALKRYTAFLGTNDGIKAYGRFWKDLNKRQEAFEKLGLFNAPNPPIPLEQEQEGVPPGARSDQESASATSKSNQS